jgi:SET domain-containing protein
MTMCSIWSQRKKTVVQEVYSLVLGWGSLFNHSYDHNTEYWHDTDRDLIVFHTIKKVSAGKQLFVNYGKEWWGSRELTPD